jgi:hypothetical protein
MEKFALLVRLEAKAGKEKEVSDFIKSALPLAASEPFTVKLYALQIGPSTFGIFDSFENEEGRNAHLGARSRSGTRRMHCNYRQRSGNRKSKYTGCEIKYLGICQVYFTFSTTNLT